MDKTSMAHEYAKIMLDKIPAHDLSSGTDEAIDVIAYIANGLAAKIGVVAPIDDEWQPDWSKIPEEYNWFAVDMDGEAFVYTFKPYRSNSHNGWGDDEGRYTVGIAVNCDNFGYSGEWQNSLRHRPPAK